MSAIQINAYKGILKLALLLVIFMLSNNCLSQDLKFEGYEIICQIPSTPVKDQYMSPTCWSFATISFIESELIRRGIGEFDLSEMFVAYHVYQRKAMQNYRMQGNNFFTGGGQPKNVLITIERNGIMTESAYSGKMKKLNHEHTKLDYLAKKFVNEIDSLQGDELPVDWQEQFKSILDSNLGEIPQVFSYKNKPISPKEFADSILKINTDNYIDITSFTHHPFYKAFCLESRYNWEQQLYYNVPLNEFVDIIEYALEKGFSVCWNGDVSEVGFDAYKGLAKLNLMDQPNQDIRQRLFDNHSTTVDHVMHIIGKAENNKNETFYLIKNSWGTLPNQGYLMMSEDYMKIKTVSIMVHKDAIPKKIITKLKIK